MFIRRFTEVKHNSTRSLLLPFNDSKFEYVNVGRMKYEYQFLHLRDFTFIANFRFKKSRAIRVSFTVRTFQNQNASAVILTPS